LYFITLLENRLLGGECYNKERERERGEKVIKQGALCFAVSKDFTWVKKSKAMRWPACRRRNMCILVGNHRGKKPKHRWEDNIKVDPN
jgi:hypothetical protein